MKDPTFTPGPWTARPAEWSSGDSYEVVDPDGELIAEDIWDRDDAALLAAAPALYAALKPVADALEGAGFSAKYIAAPDWNPDAHCEPITLTIAEARAVYAALAAARSAAPHGIGGERGGAGEQTSI